MDDLSARHHAIKSRLLYDKRPNLSPGVELFLLSEHLRCDACDLPGRSKLDFKTPAELMHNRPHGVTHFGVESTILLRVTSAHENTKITRKKTFESTPAAMGH